MEQKQRDSPRTDSTFLSASTSYVCSSKETGLDSGRHWAVSGLKGLLEHDKSKRVAFSCRYCPDKHVNQRRRGGRTARGSRPDRASPDATRQTRSSVCRSAQTGARSRQELFLPPRKASAPAPPPRQRHSHLLEVTDGVLGPGDVADHAAGQLVRGGVVVLGEGQQQSQEPDHHHHHLGLGGRHTLLQRMDDGHVPAGEQSPSYNSFLERSSINWLRAAPVNTGASPGGGGAQSVETKLIWTWSY